MITVFTATYNRAHTLPRLYESLKGLEDKEFEWLVVDDGSSDSTEELVRGYAQVDNGFSVRYVRTANGGKHRAINLGVSLAQGEAFYVVDSDDWLPPHSLGVIRRYFEQIKDAPDFIGVAGEKSTEDGKVHGGHFEAEYIDATWEDSARYRILGERAHVFKTQLLKKYPLPEYEGEKFVTEGVIYSQMSRDGLKFRWFNQSVYFFEYQETGITGNLESCYRKSPRGYLHYMSLIIADGKHPWWRKCIYKGKCISLIKDSHIPRQDVLQGLQLGVIGYYATQLLYKLHHALRG